MLLLRKIAVFFQINGTILLPSSLEGYSWCFLLRSEGLTTFPGCTKAVIWTNRSKGRGRYVQDGQNTSNMVYKVIKPGKLYFGFLKAAFKSLSRFKCHTILDAVERHYGLPALPWFANGLCLASAAKPPRASDPGISECGMFENRLFSASSIFWFC